MQTFEIKQRLTGYNEHEKKRRRNRYAANADKVRMENVIAWAIRAAKVKPVTAPQWIVYEWHEATRRRDKDNVRSRKKFINDALQKTKVLPRDDNRYVAGFTDRFVYDKTDRVIVYLIDYNEENDNDEQGSPSGISKLP